MSTTQPKQVRKTDDPKFREHLAELLRECGGDPETFEGGLISDLALSVFKLVTDGRDAGELKLLNASFKEMRYAYNVFAGHQDRKKISIFGSARTKPDHPDYMACVEFSRKMSERGWHCITGAGDGIMKAGHEGPGAANSFGLAIRLPFETTANDVIAGDNKLINFRYFFTRKLMFVSQCDAFATFPGGFGTQDEIFETLTLIQTGKSPMVPIVLCEHEGGDYWKHWDNYVRRSLLDNGLISPEDLNLYHIARDMEEAAAYIDRFYRNYHSSRYHRDDLIIRIKKPLQDGDVARLNEEFAKLVKKGEIVQRGAYDIENEHLDLPRICFTHTKHDFGMVRRMIERINDFEPRDDSGLDPSEIY
ncbi:MAG: LOG family protein [Phycisphaerales bacterium]